MNKHVKHEYWGDSIDYRDVLKKIEEIGPTLEAQAPADEEAGPSRCWWAVTMR